jgi:hypothetical protein
LVIPQETGKGNAAVRKIFLQPETLIFFHIPRRRLLPLWFRIYNKKTLLGNNILPDSVFSMILRKNYSSENSDLDAPHSGQTQSSGNASNAVPGATPLSGSPTAGS